MTGPATWEQLAYILGAVVFVGGLVYLFQELRSRDRHEHRARFQQEIASLLDQIKLMENALEQRVHALELANAGTLVTLKHIETLQAEIKKQFDALNRQRQEDMQRLHTRLDAVHNSARMITVAADRIVKRTDIIEGEVNDGGC